MCRKFVLVEEQKALQHLSQHRSVPAGSEISFQQLVSLIDFNSVKGLVPGGANNSKRVEDEACRTRLDGTVGPLAEPAE